MATKMVKPTKEMSMPSAALWVMRPLLRALRPCRRDAKRPMERRAK